MVQEPIELTAHNFSLHDVDNVICEGVDMALKNALFLYRNTHYDQLPAKVLIDIETDKLGLTIRLHVKGANP